jgi:hypothetical protein
MCSAVPYASLYKMHILLFSFHSYDTEYQPLHRHRAFFSCSLNDGDIFVILRETIFEQRYISISNTKPALVSKLNNEIQLERRSEYVRHVRDDLIYGCRCEGLTAIKRLEWIVCEVSNSQFN